MTDVIEFFLAGPVRGKERVKRAARGHSYTPERTVNYEGRMALAAQTAMAGRAPLEGPLGLSIIMRFAVPASKSKRFRDAALRGEIRPIVTPDWDNGGKLTDSCNLVVWVDDRQIVEATVRKEYSETPGMWVRVWRIAPNGAGIFG